MPVHELRGTIRPDAPLLVVAAAEEAQFLRTGLPVLITGVGKVNAAIAVTGVLTGATRPAAIVNLGTAGALRDGLAGVHLVRTAIQHDLNSRVLLRLTGEVFGERLELPDRDGVTLATGDVFVADSGVRERLAERADLVDMEGYAVAAAGARYGVPVRIVKQVSDRADENARQTWPEAVAACARILADWVDSSLG